MAAPSQAAKVVLISGSVMGAVTVFQATRRPETFAKGGVYKQVWAIGVLTLALAAAADFAPSLVVPFSVAVVVAFVIKNPGGLGSLLQGQSQNPYTQGGPPGVQGPVGTPRRTPNIPPGPRGPIH